MQRFAITELFVNTTFAYDNCWENYMIKNYKKSLIEPLDKGELHILHTSYWIEKLISQIVYLINEKAHGVYLVGGLRGIGKTSLLNLCLREVQSNKYCRIKIDANKIHDKSDFLYFIVEELYTALHGNITAEEINVELENLKQIVVEKRIVETGNSIDLNIKNEKYNKELIRESTLFQHGLFNNLFNRQLVIENEESMSAIKSESVTNANKIVFSERIDDFIIIDKLSRLLKTLDEYHKYTIVISIDELDKQSSLSIESIFDYYKNLLLNSHIIVFMCVDTLKYAKVTAGNYIDNEYRSYFTDCFYMPTLEYQELVKYLYREFLINDHDKAIMVNYESCGIFRKINTHQFISKKSDKVYLAALAFHLMMDGIKIGNFYDNYEYDIFKVLLKEALQILLKYKQITMNELCDFLSKKEFEYDLKFEFTSQFIDSFSKIELLINNVETISIPHNSSNNKTFKIINDALPVKSFTDIKKITFSNEYIGQNINRSIYSKDCIPILIEQRNNDAFYYFERFVETLGSKIENIIVIEKICNWDKAEVQTYSGIVVVNKTIGRVAYIIEDCSCSYEGKASHKDVLDFLEKLGIKKIIVSTDEVPIQDNLDYIFEKVDSIIYG